MAAKVKVAEFAASTARYAKKAALAADKNKDGKLSKAEAKALPKDLRDDYARQAKTKNVTPTSFAADQAAYVAAASRRADKNKDGVLTATEASKLPAALKNNYENYAASLDSTPGTAGGAAKTSAAIITAMGSAMSGLDGFCESGDHGVNVSIRKVPGRTLAEVMTKVHLDPGAPWTHAEKNLDLWPAGTVAKAIDAFTTTAKEALELERTDMPDVVASFTNGVRAQFGGLTDVRLVSGRDLGSTYLIGKAADGYVAVVVQPYRD